MPAVDLEAHSGDDSDTLEHKSRLLKRRLDIEERELRLAKQKLAADEMDLVLRQRAKRSGKPLPAARPHTPPQPTKLEAHFSSPRASGGRSSSSFVQVPVSPSPRRTLPPVSPARHVLGIDKGLTGRHISLKPSPQKPTKTFNQRRLEHGRDAQASTNKALSREAARASGFNNLMPAFSAVATGKAQKDIYTEPVGNFRIHDPVADKEALDAAVKNIGEHCYDLRHLFAAVSPPDYELDDAIIDFLVVGVIARKSDTQTTRNANASKYCTLVLTDFKLDIHIQLYDTAFEEFWKLPVGTVVYLLNPTIQKPRPGASADKMSLKISDSAKILEVAKASDFGLCRAIKQDGQQCGQWIHAGRQAEGVCDYHLELKFEKNARKRTEFASGSRPHDPFQPTEKKRKEAQAQARNSVFFGDAVTTLPGGGQGFDQHFDKPIKNSVRLQREGEQRKSERQGVAKLLQSNPPSAANEYFQLSTEDGSALPDEPVDDRASVFSASRIRKIGYDPTRRAHLTSAGQHDKPIAELAAELTKNEEDIDLTVMRNHGSSKFYSALQDAQKRSAERPTSSSTLPLALDDDTDSDLEIVR